jgi:hypothetical protein
MSNGVFCGILIFKSADVQIADRWLWPLAIWTRTGRYVP